MNNTNLTTLPLLATAAIFILSSCGEPVPHHHRVLAPEPVMPPPAVTTNHAVNPFPRIVSVPRHNLPPVPSRPATPPAKIPAPVVNPDPGRVAIPRR